MPAELVLPIVCGVILLGVIAASAGDVDGDRVGAAVVCRRLPREVALCDGVQDALGAVAFPSAPLYGSAVREEHVYLGPGWGGGWQELGQHQVGAGGDGEVRAQIEMPAELVLPIVRGAVLLGVVA